LSIGIDPQRRAGVAEVAVGIGAEIFSRLRGGGGCVPAEGAGGAGGRGFAAGEKGNGFWAEDRTSALEKSVGESGEIFSAGEKAGVAGDASED